MSAAPRCHIIIVSYHNSADLRRCLPALVASVGQTPVTIVDNAAPDPALDWIRSEYPQWEVLSNPGNAGFGHANNRAAQRSSADYLVFLNPDTLPYEGWLAALVDAMEAQPQVGLASPALVLQAEPSLLNTAGNSVHYTGLAACRGLREPLAHHAQPCIVPAISGACFIMPRQLFEALGGFDETFFLYLEDSDLSLRARLLGYHALYVPQARVAHDYQFRLGGQKTFYQEGNRYLLLLKLFRWPSLLVLLPMLLLAEALVWAFLLLRNRAGIWQKLRAYSWLWGQRASLRASRRRLQQQRRCSDRALLRSLDAQLHLEAYDATPIAGLGQRLFNWMALCYYTGLLQLIRW